MNPHERKRAQEEFRTSAQICVATEAAGEGINLQFCHLMINYDMPWNPTRMEQRLGRIHRIGQDRDCYAFNFVATDSEDGQPIIEGRILHRLLEKLDRMNDALEGRVFDVIGEVLSLNDVNLPSEGWQASLHCTINAGPQCFRLGAWRAGSDAAGTRPPARRASGATAGTPRVTTRHLI